MTVAVPAAADAGDEPDASSEGLGTAEVTEGPGSALLGDGGVRLDWHPAMSSVTVSSRPTV